MKILKEKNYNVGKEYIISKVLYKENDTFFIKQVIDATEKGNQMRKKINMPPFNRNEDIHAVSRSFAKEFLSS